ncbi:hypothetical protein [Flavivirga jejuensis]|uniref:Uncharacterized protein n=1 Tax=Flavivirga jejuensis TaxID=870487 RepID=A0ABT8WQE4_9FLAO|nr:hypothetical protein [Flavivirga jejuensis]MDO5975132.1 hypothetical protein [Flavivirga jejuensis]
MGSLNEVYQLKPITLSASAVLKVKKNCEESFLKRFDLEEIGSEVKGFFSDTFVYKSDDGKVERMAIYSAERLLDLQEPGIYLSIQSDGKWGFNDAFIKGIERTSPYLEDTLFFVIYDTRISRFNITNGKLHIKETTDFDQWDHAFDKYVLYHYKESPQLIADYYKDEVIEMRLFLEELVDNDDDPRSYYELEEYEELLNKIIRFGKYIPMEELKIMKDWLQEQIVLQKKWEENYYR